VLDAVGPVDDRTVLEIAFGAVIKGTLNQFYLDLLTAAMFFLFAYLLYRSIPERGSDRASEGTTDGGMREKYAELDVSVLGYKIPNLLGGFLPIFVMMAVGEFGDKTQWITITLAANYGAHPAIWFGEMLAIIPVSIVNAYFFYRFSHRFDVRKAHIVGALIFLFFAFDTVLSLTVGFSIWETFVGTVADFL
ncbi:MAG: TMEM165/GDT1 family protein, partial [Halobacteria archaeon]|nr:TMEM165/GDT1 family protein [Halobacteria archaeon]